MTDYDTKALKSYIENLNRKDDFFSAERALIDFAESVIKIHGQFRGRHRLYYFIWEWLADKLLWR